MSGHANSQWSAQDMGFPGAAPPTSDVLPPGGGGAAVPQFLSYAGVYNLTGNLYRFLFDQALNDSIPNALAMENDPVIYSALNDRQIQTAQVSWHIEPFDETNPAEVEAAQAITRTIEHMPGRQQYRMWLLDAIWRGKSAVEMVYQWDFSNGRRTLRPVDWWPLNGDKLRGNPAREWGVYVYGAFPGSAISSDQGMVHMLTPGERQQFVIHQFEPRDANWMQPNFAGQVLGVGLRSRIYWFWWLKTNTFAMLTNYLERFAQGVTILRYPAHDAQAKQEMIALAQQQWGKAVMIFPRWPSERGNDSNDFQRIEAGTASPALLQELVTNYYDSEIRRAILHQDLTTGTAPTGMGSGVAMAHSDTMSRVVKYDCIDLQETEQRDLVNMLYRWDFPGIRPGRIVYEIDDPNAEELLGNAQIYYEMGGEVDMTQLAKALRLPLPQPGNQIASKVGDMQPAAIQGNAPDGVPVVGQPGPMPAGQPGVVPGTAPQPGMVPGQQAMPPPQMVQAMRRMGATPTTSRRGFKELVKLLRQKKYGHNGTRR